MAISNETETETDISGMAVAQGDLAVNLFIILLIVLSVMEITQPNPSENGFLIQSHNRMDKPDIVFPVKSWKPIASTYPKLFLYKQTLYWIDLRPIATSFAAEEKTALGKDALDTSRMLLRDINPAAFLVFLRFSGELMPESIILSKVGLASLESEEGAEFMAPLSRFPSVDLFVDNSNINALAPVLERLASEKIDTRLGVIPSKGVFGFSASGKNYGLERSFK